MRLHRYALLVLAVALLSLSVYAGEDDYDYDTWIIGAAGDWTSTNWLGSTRQPLPAPGYPGTNAIVEIQCGTVSVTTQDVTTICLNIRDSGTLIVTNSRTVQLDVLNMHRNRYTPGHMVIADGTVNVLNDNTNQLRDLVVDLGTSGNGYLDLGATWGATNGFQGNYGDVGGLVASVNKGGLRIDANSVNMALGCHLNTYGQEITFRGDWINPDGSTVLTINGAGPGTVSIAGNFSFGGCRLNETVDTNGVELIQVGGDASLTNVTLTIGATDTLTNPAASYDLVRVPSAKTIYTNGMTFNVASNGGFNYAASLDLNRGGYDYLVITPSQFLPSVTITNPANNSLYQAVTNLSIQATATGRSSPISKVEFYVDTTNKIGEATTAPYSVTWSNVYAGAYELKAIATDANGNQGVSSVVDVNIQGTAADGKKVFITGGAIIRYDPACAQ